MGVYMKELKFYLITDTHYFENSLGAYGKEYDEFMRYEQKCFAETQSINESVFAWLEKADETDIVLIAGDLSFNGEKESHKGFVKLLSSLQAAGKKVYVVTADHDFNDMPFAFNETGRIQPEGTKRDELFDIYKAFGFGEAIAVDREHLSYVAQLGEGVRLLALNNDGSRDNRRNFDGAHIEWIKAQAQKAKDDGQMMIAMNHFPLLPCQPLFSIVSGTMQKESAKAAEILADSGVHIVFTGHMHQQSVNEFVSEKGNKLYDVCTGSIIADPAIIRLVTVKSEIEVEIKSIPTPDFKWDTKGKTCKQYLQNTFDAMIVNLLEDMKNDPKRMMRKFGIKESKGIVFAVHQAGKLLNSITLGTLCRLMFVKCHKSIRKMKLKSFAVELVRGVFEGNQKMVEGTPEGDAFIGFLKRINPILKKINIKTFDGKRADLFELLKNTAGNYGIDDYNAALILK